MKKSLRQSTIFILVFSLIISMGMGPYVYAEGIVANEEEAMEEMAEDSSEEPTKVEAEVEAEKQKDKLEDQENEKLPEESGEDIPEKVETATLIINHLGNNERLQPPVIKEGLEVGGIVDINDYINYSEEIIFIGAETREGLEVGNYYTLLEGDNELNLYYEFIEILPEEPEVEVEPEAEIEPKPELEPEVEVETEVPEVPEKLVEPKPIEEEEVHPIGPKPIEEEEIHPIGPRPIEEEEIYPIWPRPIEEEEMNPIKVEPEPVKERTSLLVNHFIKEDDKYESIETQIIEELEIGKIIYAIDFIKEFEGLIFLESDNLELPLMESDNELKLYYGVISNGDNEIGEAPDFPPGEGMEIESPYIQEFGSGEFGPFSEVEDFSRMNLFNMMSLENYSDEVNNKIWPNPGSLKINKTGKPVAGSGNQFEITLEIEGKSKSKTSDVVLVIDRSGSMGDDGRMKGAKNAAISFVNELLKDPNTTTRIALVSFSGDATIYNSNNPFIGYGGKSNLISAINGLSANGGTHIQAGIRQGIAVLKGSSADNKAIVFLGDGGATYSYKPNNPGNYLENYPGGGSGSRKRTTSAIPQSGFSYGTTVGNGSNEYTNYSGNNYYRHGAHAVAEAGFAPANQNIYTIALGAGTEGEWTLKNMANAGYYSTANPANLTQIYSEIAGSISSAAEDAIVTDPLGDMYDILGINASNYNSLITVNHGTLSYDTTSERITWNIGTISEGTIYTMKYKVNLDYSAEGGVFYPANKPTYISYKNIDGDQGKKYFPIPEFRLRELEFTKILNNGKAEDSNKQFDIILKGPNGRTWSVSLKPGESKKIKGLLPGTYTVKEILPMNFKLTGMSGGGISPSGQLLIRENDWKISVDITNERTNDGWFWDDPDPTINSFTLAGNKRGLSASLPTDNKLIYGILDYFVIPATLEMEDKFYQS